MISVNIIITSQQGVASVRRPGVDWYLHNLHTVTTMVLLLSRVNTHTDYVTHQAKLFFLDSSDAMVNI